MSTLTRLHDSLTSLRHSREWHHGCPTTLRSALAEICPGIDPESWQRRIEEGGVYVNGQRALADVALSAPVRVEYFEPRSPSGNLEDLFPPFDPSWVIHEDDAVLALFKPPGLPTLPTRDQQRFNLRAYIERYVGGPVHMPSRLDTSACGIVLVSRAQHSHRAVQHLFERGTVGKWYLLETSGLPSWQAVGLDAPIGRDPSHQVLRRVVADESSKSARTELEALGGRGSTGYVLARPLTGRTHQLRVHCAFLGYPLVGDNFYGGLPAETLHLLAYALRLRHPVSRELLTLRIPGRLLPAWAVAAAPSADAVLER